MTVATAYKVRVKLGQAEFDAEGPEETVRKNLADFLQIAPSYADRAEKKPGPDPAVSFNSSDAAITDEHVGASATATHESRSSSWDTSLDRQVINRLFKEERNGLISLRVLPGQSADRAADTLFLLLFGFLILKGRSEVKATELLACAKQSGIALGRIDHTIERQRFRSLIKRGGSRNLSRYALTNPGILHAEEVASKIFG